MVSKLFTIWSVTGKVHQSLLYATLLRHSTSLSQSYLKIRATNEPITLTWETAQASSGFSRRRRENSIRTLQAAATD